MHLPAPPVRPIAIARMLVVVVGLAACFAAPAAEAGRRSAPPSPVAPSVQRSDPHPRARQVQGAAGNPLHRLNVRAVARGAAALAKGTAIDGPRHTGRAIRKNPRTFAAGTVLIGTMGVVAHALGWNGEHIALVLSTAAVAAQVRAAWPTLKRARGNELARRIGADVLWPAALFGLSYGVGHAIGGHGPPAHAQGIRDLATAFAAAAVIGGDAPAVGVTALDTRRGGSSR